MRNLIPALFLVLGIFCAGAAWKAITDIAADDRRRKAQEASDEWSNLVGHTMQLRWRLMVEDSVFTIVQCRPGENFWGGGFRIHPRSWPDATESILYVYLSWLHRPVQISLPFSLPMIFIVLSVVYTGLATAVWIRRRVRSPTGNSW